MLWKLLGQKPIHPHPDLIGGGDCVLWWEVGACLMAGLRRHAACIAGITHIRQGFAERAGFMRALTILTVVMGVMIVAGVVVLGVTLVNRLNAPAAIGPAALDEPAGTSITQISAAGDRLSVLLHGGGPDRIVVLDVRNGHVITRTGLAH